MTRSHLVGASLLLILSSLGRPLDAQPVRFECDTVFRIDGYEAEFSALRSVAAGPENQVAVSERLSRSVRLFDSLGRKGPDLGREGQGPGEFTGIGSLGWVSDSIWAFDARLDRFTLFGSGGGEEGFRTYRREERAAWAPPGSGMPSFAVVLPRALYPDGSVLGSLLTPLSENAGGGSTIGLVGPGGELRRIVARYSGLEGFSRHDGDGRAVGWSYPFEHDPVMDVAPDGSALSLAVVATVEDSDCVIVLRRFDASGDTVFTRSLRVEGETIPEDVREEALLESADRLYSQVGSSKWRREYLQNDRTPGVYPPARDIVAGSKGRTWLGVRKARVGVEYYAFGPGGEIEGILRLPGNARLVEARGNRLWAVEKDGYDVESLMGLRLRRGGDAPGNH